MMPALDGGGNIHHPTFGPGTVLSADPRRTVIAFSGRQITFSTEVLASVLNAPLDIRPALPHKPQPPHRPRTRSVAIPAPAPQCVPPPVPPPAAAPARCARPTVTCQQCGKRWQPYNGHKPKRCNFCNSPNWNLPKRDWRKVSGARRRKYTSSAAIDRVIREAYTLLRKHRDRSAVKDAARAIGWPKWAVNRRALVLGISHVKEADWSAQEVETLKLWEHLGLEAIQRKLAAQGFARSRTAINLKIKRLGIRKQRDWYSAFKLSEAFGVDSHVIASWIRRGWLKGDRRGTARKSSQGGDSWVIMHADVKAFVFAHPEQIELSHVEKFWFLELLTDGQIQK